jgi:hypothetical protein
LQRNPQAYIYGEILRVAIDLYRFDLLKALHQSLPETPNEEIELWDKLLKWLYISDRGCVTDVKYKHDRKKLI